MNKGIESQGAVNGKSSIEPLLSSKEVRIILGIGKTKLSNLTVSGAVQSVRLGGNLGYRPVDIRQYIDDHVEGLEPLALRTGAS